VTGANRGIGLAFVEELLERGVAKVYAGVRDPIASAGAFTHSAAEVIQLDVTTLTSVEQAAGRCGDTTILINNAGYHARDRLVLADDPEAARQEMEVNYFGVLNMTRAFAPVLGANGGGGIINVLSVAGAFPTAFMGGYSPAKAAALWLSTIARAELSAQGTAVTALIVGSVDTRMAEHVAGRKEDPRHIARVGLDAYLRGERVSDTDYMAVQARADYARDPALWERRVAKLVGSDNLSTGR
jgi:NAD(P)-dependent dehydrogenase (short-subunit alcohol dehydrogenase family)